MKRKLSYKTKVRLLYAGSFLFLLMVYSFTFGKTILLAQQCSELQNDGDRSVEAENNFDKLNAEYSLMQKDWTLGKDSSLTLRQKLLGDISSFCDGKQVLIRDFPSTVIRKESDCTLEINMIVLEGRYNDLLETVFNLEKKKSGGKISSLEFHLEKNQQDHRNHLLASVYFQGVRSFDHDNNKTK